MSKLKWHCRRGVKELDIVLSQYLDNHYANDSKIEKATFKALVALEDPILLAMLMGDIEPANLEQQKMLEKLRNQNNQ